MSISFDWVPARNELINGDFFTESDSLPRKLSSILNGELIFTFLPPDPDNGRTISLNPKTSALWTKLSAFKKAGGIERYHIPSDWSASSNAFCIKQFSGSSDSHWYYYLSKYRPERRDGGPEGADAEEYGPADYRCAWSAPVLGLFRKINSDGRGYGTFYCWGSINWGDDSIFYWTDGTRTLTFLGVFDITQRQYFIYLIDYTPATWWNNSWTSPFQNGGELPLALIGYQDFLPDCIPRNKTYSISNNCIRADEDD